MPKPLAILFDAGNVLLRLKTAQFLEKVEKACPGLNQEKMLAELRQEGQHHAYERGEITGAQFHAHLREKYSLGWDYAEWLKCWNDYFLPNRPMEATLAKLRGQARLWVLSNTNAEHWEHARREFRLFDAFEGLVASHEQGRRKPDPEFFKIALGLMRLNPAEVLFVDDLKMHVEAAQNLGMQYFHYTFNDLEFKAYLKGLGFELPAWESRPSPFAC